MTRAEKQNKLDTQIKQLEIDTLKAIEDNNTILVTELKEQLNQLWEERNAL